MPYNLDFSHITPNPMPNAAEFTLWALRSYQEYCNATSTPYSTQTLVQFLFAASQLAIQADVLYHNLPDEEKNRPNKPLTEDEIEYEDDREYENFLDDDDPEFEK